MYPLEARYYPYHAPTLLIALSYYLQYKISISKLANEQIY